MDFSEKIFHWTWKLSHKWKRREKKSEFAARLSDYKDPLSMISCAFFGKTIFLKEAEGVGGLIGNSLFLPDTIDYFENLEDNYLFYKFKILYSHIAINLGLGLKSGVISREEHHSLSIKSYPKIMARLSEEYPNLNNFLEIISKDEDHIDMSFSYLPIEAQILSIKSNKESIINEDGFESEETLRKTKSKEKVNFKELDDENPDCNPVSLLMEAVNTADLFSGGQKMVDGSDELDDHFDAIESLDIRELTRSSVQTRSIFNADISVQIKDMREEDKEIERLENVFEYDEWNSSSHSYKKNWCHLVEDHIRVNGINIEENKKLHAKRVLKYDKEIKSLKQFVRSLFFDKKLKNRQAQGDDFDLDALVEKNIDLKCGHVGRDNIFIKKHRDISELAVCTLIDASLSADSYIKGRKVLEITKDSVTILQQAIEQVFQFSMVASFNSNTRKKCQYNLIKDFDEKWMAKSSHLNEVKATGYTRIGTALRHSLFKLEKIKTRRKVIILFSDGKPTDYDAYEGDYGIADVRQCVREGKSQGVDIISIAIDKEAKFYFPKLFGTQNYQVLERPEEIAYKMTKLLYRLME